LKILLSKVGKEDDVAAVMAEAGHYGEEV